MKAKISTYLFIIYLFSATEVSQLLKLPILFSHFLEHRVKNPKMSFDEFIYHHYAVEHQDDGDAETDRKLPFKSHDTCASFVFPIEILEEIQISLKHSLLEIQSKTIVHSSADILSRYLSSIWQPPQY